MQYTITINQLAPVVVVARTGAAGTEWEPLLDDARHALLAVQTVEIDHEGALCFLEHRVTVGSCTCSTTRCPCIHRAARTLVCRMIEAERSTAVVPLDPVDHLNAIDREVRIESLKAALNRARERARRDMDELYA